MSRRSVERRQARRSKARERWGTTKNAPIGAETDRGVEDATDKTDARPTKDRHQEHHQPSRQPTINRRGTQREV